jgi:hypothetical protein
MFEWITPEVWRRMIRAAFEPSVGLDGTQHAIRLWDDNFAEFEDIQAQIRPFVYAYTQSTGRPDLRVKITLQLITMLRTPLETLPSDPNSLGDAPPDQLYAVKAVQAESFSPVVRASLEPSNDATLATLVLKLREILSFQPNSAELLTHYDRLIFDFISSKKLKLMPEQITHWIAWAQAPYKRELASLLNPVQCTQIISYVYVFMSEWVGPVVADEWLNRAIHLVELTPTGKAISPRIFL